jgi:hypothetical protein
MAATMRRLSDADVRAIFESLHGSRHPPPPHLTFQIVPVGSDGLKLSPPSHEFEGKTLHRMNLLLDTFDSLLCSFY